MVDGTDLILAAFPGSQPAFHPSLNWREPWDGCEHLPAGGQMKCGLIKPHLDGGASAALCTA